MPNWRMNMINKINKQIEQRIIAFLKRPSVK